MSWPVHSVPPCEPAWEIDAAPLRPDTAIRPASPPDAAQLGDDLHHPDATACTSSVGQRACGAADTAPAEAATRRLLTGVLEAIDGRRSPEALRRFLAPDVFAQICGMCQKGHGAAASTGGRLRTVSVSPTQLPVRNPHVAHTSTFEVCATFARGPRVFAVAARVRIGRGGAYCLALRMLA